jgi:hypothetical protein
VSIDGHDGDIAVYEEDIDAGGKKGTPECAPDKSGCPGRPKIAKSQANVRIGGEQGEEPAQQEG